MKKIVSVIIFSTLLLLSSCSEKKTETYNFETQILKGLEISYIQQFTDKKEISDTNNEPEKDLKTEIPLQTEVAVIMDRTPEVYEATSTEELYKTPLPEHEIKTENVTVIEVPAVKTADAVIDLPQPTEMVAAETEKPEKPIPTVSVKVQEKPEQTEDNKELSCVLSVRCDTLLKNINKLTSEKTDIVPKDGVIFKEKEIVFYEDESVFDVLVRVMRENKIHLEFVNVPIYKSAYIEGIGNLYELDCGELSGWMYKVNGWFPNYGCSRYMLEDGDKIEWVYTCDLGADVGGAYSNGNGR